MIRALWRLEKPSFDGRFWSFAGIDAQPRPVQQPCPPIVIGGHSPAAHRRAVERGNGWYGFALDTDGTAKALEGLAAAAEQADRSAELGELEISVTPPPRVTLEDVKRYSDLGVDRLVLLVNAKTVDETCDRVSQAAESFIGRT